MVTFPPSGNFLQAVRDSCKALRLEANIQISDEYIDRLLSSPAFRTSFGRVSKNHGLALPLNFSSPLDELNFISTLSILNFASGYRVPLHSQTGRGAWDSIRALAFGLYITSTTGEGDLLSARGMRSLDASKIAELMGVSIHVEKPHEKLPGVVIGEIGGPLYQLVKMIADVLIQTGEILENSGYQNLGAFVAEALKTTNNLAPQLRADVVVERLVRASPAFRDMSEVLGKPVYCFKKALFLVEAIAIRFGHLDPPPFPIPSTDHLPVFSDNVLPSMLIHLGVIDTSAASSLDGVFSGARRNESLGSLLESGQDSGSNARLNEVPEGGPVLTNDQAYILRAAAIDACELIVQRAKNLPQASGGSSDLDWIRSLTLPTFDMWLWAVAKDRSDYRKLQRFVATDTVFF